MTYSELVECMHRFHCEELSRLELVAAIGLWQRAGSPL
jgi:hypothetical protein